MKRELVIVFVLMMGVVCAVNDWDSFDDGSGDDDVSVPDVDVSPPVFVDDSPSVDIESDDGAGSSAYYTSYIACHPFLFYLSILWGLFHLWLGS